MSLKKINFLLLSLILFTNTTFAPIISSTLIKTPHGLAAVEKLNIGDTVIEYNDKSLSTSQVTHISTSIIDTVIAITTDKGCIHVSPDQYFFDPVFEKWIAAQDLTIKNTFFNAQLNHCKCLNVEKINVAEIKTYCITTTFPHAFFITEQELLSHNTFPVLIGLAWLFGEGLKFAGITLGTAIFGSYVGLELYNAQKQKNRECNISFHTTPCGGPCPDPDDDDFYKQIKLKFHKKFRHQRFGNFYRDPQTKLIWSKDNAGHGGVVFKVFKETSKGLKWIFDADGLGNKIIGKHKGPTGLFISYKELIPCQ